MTEGPINLPTTNQYSLNPSIVGDNSDNLHIVWQQSNSSIRYLHSYVSGVPYGNRYFEPNSYNVSTGAGYSTNEYPSVSLTDFNQAIIIWKAGRHENPSKLVAGEETDLIWVSRVLVRPFWITSGGDFYAAGLNVNYSNNNSTTENGVTNSVIAYSQNNGESCRWIKRTAFGYTAAGSFNENGIQVQLSSGGNFSQIKAVVFENATAPFHLQKSNTNFLSKITSLEPGYSRTGVVRKEEVEFVFSFGDLRLDGENILFIEKSDTLPIPGVSEFNQYFRTENFYIDHTSQLLFSVYYFVLNPEVAQTVLSDNDEIVYKVELVNANSGEVVGLFDEVTFDKNTLFDHDNTNYSVDCSEVTADEYYFRLVTEVMGEYYYHLSNEQNDSETLGKKIYDNISYLGKLESLTYALAQNYPNPFNPSTRIQYQVSPGTQSNWGASSGSYVTLKVYDVLGNEVAILVDEFKPAGSYEVEFDPASSNQNPASGVYFYQLKVYPAIGGTGDYVATKKMLLLR